MAKLRAKLLVAYSLLLGVHLAIVLNALPPAVIFGGVPLGSPDYQTHFAQMQVLSEASTRFGRTWAYDPGLLAGQPEGLVFSLDNRGHAAFSRILERAGVERSTAFNLFVLLSSLLMPLSVWSAARLLEIGRGSELVATGAAILLWHFDWAPHFAWHGGMISFATVAHGSLVALAAFHRLLHSRSLGLWLLLAALLPLLVFVHVLSVVILIVPMLALYVYRFRHIGRTEHALTWAVTTATLALSLVWLYPVLSRMDLIAPSNTLGQAGPASLLLDYIGIHPIDPTSIGTQTPFRFAVLAGAIMTLRTWRKEGDRRFLVAFASLAWLLGITYLASLLPLLGQTEPYRFVFPAMLMAGVVSSAWFVEALKPARLREMQPLARSLVIVLAVLVLPRLIRSVMFAIPELEPSGHQPDGLVTRSRTSRVTLPPPDDRLVASLLKEQIPVTGRVLVQSWPLAELLRWATPWPILGGFPERRLIQQAANPFRNPVDARLVGDELRQYLDRYNVHYLVMTDPAYPMVESRADLFEPLQVIFRHRVYRVRKPGTYFSSGAGQVTAELNRLTVHAASPEPGTQSLVLKFHWLDELRCQPG